jgi:hypothetical protein
MDREHPQQASYVDLQDGPSSLQKREQYPTLKEQSPGHPLFFETEREKHSKELSMRSEGLRRAQAALKYDKGLRSPKEKREELLEIKTELEGFNAMKTQQVFFGKRDRIFKGGWRHGILGVEDADSKYESSVFYKEQKEHRDHANKEKEAINAYRKKSKYTLYHF